MAIPDFSDVSKTMDAKVGVPRAIAPAMPIPAFSDISKLSNDLLGKDFYHATLSTLDVKLKTPTGVNVAVKGKQTFDGNTAGSIEGKYTDKSKGKASLTHSRMTFFLLPPSQRQLLVCTVMNMSKPSLSSTSPSSSHRVFALTYSRRPGLTVTNAWSTAAVLDTKFEFEDVIAKGVKAEAQSIFSPKFGAKGQKLNFYFKQPNLHARAFLDHGAGGNINAVLDAVVGHEGFLVGAEAGYDVQKAAVTRYSAAVGYQTPGWTASIQGIQNLSVFAASYYQMINASVEAGAKATYDVQNGSKVGLELASKYKLDPASFAKAKINDRGIAALAYNTKVNTGLTFGIGMSLDTSKLNEGGHKIGTSFTFEG
ncbi:Mitochondrial porin [Elasticomyces elasticus]|nr:Mitochondrial porin [Elasticomyces elasticus]